MGIVRNSIGFGATDSMVATSAHRYVSQRTTAACALATVLALVLALAFALGICPATALAAEISNATASSKNEPLASIEGFNELIVDNSTLSSEVKDPTSNDVPAYAVLMCRAKANDLGDNPNAHGLFQASNSKLSSAIESGAFFFLTNTRARIILSKTELKFDSSKAALLTASGTSAKQWGTPGKNGATATLTGIEQNLNGAVLVDDISSVDLYLLRKSTWNGNAGFIANDNGDGTNTGTLNVHVDSTSKWTLTEDSTITTLNIQKGGALVDAENKPVRIVDDDHNTLVDGTSDIELTVLGTFTTEVEPDSRNELAKPSETLAQPGALVGVGTVYTKPSLGGQTLFQRYFALMSEALTIAGFQRS